MKYMYWFENHNSNKYELLIENPRTYTEDVIAEVYYDEEEQTWAWIDTIMDVGYFGFETPEEAQKDCERFMEPENYLDF
jgi:hypothetical protein